MIKQVGAGIIMANNAMQIYKKLGLDTQITEKGNSISRINITDDNLKPLSSMDLSAFEEKYLLKNIAIHRAELQNILLNALTNTEIHLAHTLTNIVHHDNGVDMTFINSSDGSHSNDNQSKKVTADIVIGADGIHSAVRNKLLPNNSIRKAKQVCWRGVTEYRLAEQYQHEINEMWGKTARFGFVQIAQNTVYWYALKSFKNNVDEFTIDELPAYFAEDYQLITDLINATDINSIHTAEMADLVPTDT